jgi:hypothetical protein
MRFSNFGFFIKHLPLDHWFTPKNIFLNGGEFDEIFEFQIADDAAESVKINFCI